MKKTLTRILLIIALLVILSSLSLQAIPPRLDNCLYSSNNVQPYACFDAPVEILRLRASYKVY
jgi:hypothetical protein